MKKYIIFILLIINKISFAQNNFTHQDSLRGSLNENRDWWDVKHYKLAVYIDLESQEIFGNNLITFEFTKENAKGMQIDLQVPLKIDSIIYHNQKLAYQQDGNAWLIKNTFNGKINTKDSIQIFYHGKPKKAINPPWDGGLVWQKDEAGKPWVSIACQGLGASVWFPLKDHQSEEPENGTNIIFSINQNLEVISNGNLIKKYQLNKTKYFEYQVKNPINSYNSTFYIGDYISWSEIYKGEKGDLKVSYFALKNHEKLAKKQYEEVPKMLKSFEYWLGAYPFYEDGYTIVEAPYLGMEHQSAIAYGNQFKKGYLGEDRSHTNIGLSFDFIIIHESGHEWFGNNISTKDIADNWIHEGFTTYTETLYVESILSKKEAFAYQKGQWRNIDFSNSLIGYYGINKESEGSIYDKGSAVVHMIRIMMNDDEKFRQMLRKMNKEFYHKMVTTQEIEMFIINESKLDLKSFFQQYLREKELPIFAFEFKGNQLKYKWINIEKGFKMKHKVWIDNKEIWLNTTDETQILKTKGKQLKVDDNFLIQPKKVENL